MGAMLCSDRRRFTLQTEGPDPMRKTLSSADSSHTKRSPSSTTAAPPQNFLLPKKAPLARPYVDNTEEYYEDDLPTTEESESEDNALGDAEPPPEPPPIRWRKGELIGAGAYGRVHMGMNLESGELIAVKQVLIASNSMTKEKAQEQVRELEQEVANLRGLSHPNIVRYLGTAKEEGALNIFLEFVPGGSIATMLQKFGCFNEKIIRVFTRQLMLGLEYLHANGIMHRDIKGANILMTSDGCIKLADFGASKKLADLQATMSEGYKSMKGTPYWMAPEVIKQTGHGRQADIWSVGCTVIEMATGKPPWSQFQSQVSALFHIAQAKGPPPIPENLSPAAKEFLLLCFRRDPKMRPSARALLEHPFLTDLSKPAGRASSHLAPPPPLRDSAVTPIQRPDTSHDFAAEAGPPDNRGGVSHGMDWPHGTSTARSDPQDGGADATGSGRLAEALHSRDFSDLSILSDTNPMAEPSYIEDSGGSPNGWSANDHEVNGPLRNGHHHDYRHVDASQPLPSIGRLRQGEGAAHAGPAASVAEEADAPLRASNGFHSAGNFDEDLVTEEKIKGFLEEKALELKRLQTPLFEQLLSLRQTQSSLLPIPPPAKSFPEHPQLAAHQRAGESWLCDEAGPSGRGDDGPGSATYGTGDTGPAGLGSSTGRDPLSAERYSVRAEVADSLGPLREVTGMPRSRIRQPAYAPEGHARAGAGPLALSATASGGDEEFAARGSLKKQQWEKELQAELASKREEKRRSRGRNSSGSGSGSGSEVSPREMFAPRETYFRPLHPSSSSRNPR